MRFYDINDNPRSVGTHFTEKTKTQQHFRDECDINKIMVKFGKTGILPVLQGAFQGDFSNVESYQDAMTKIINVQDHFNMLPAKVRAEFKNDPGILLDFLGKVENKQKAIELGLIAKPAEAPKAEAPAST